MCKVSVGAFEKENNWRKNKSRKLCTNPWTKFQVDTALICNVRNNYPAIRWNILNENFFFGNFIHCDNEHTQNVTLIYTSFMRKTVEKGTKIPIFWWKYRIRRRCAYWNFMDESICLWKIRCFNVKISFSWKKESFDEK